jgi:hypothetical protein
MKHRCRTPNFAEPTRLGSVRFTSEGMIDTAALLEQALSLPEHERAKLAALLESLDEEAQNDVDAAWAAEIERRCAGPLATRDWTNVRARIEPEILGRQR